MNTLGKLINDGKYVNIPGSDMHFTRCNLVGGCNEVPVGIFTSQAPGVSFADPACETHLRRYFQDRILFLSGSRDGDSIRPFTPEEREAVNNAWHEKADIILPRLSDSFAMPAVPIGALISLDGTQFQLVNWGDFRGWEVRRAYKASDGMGSGAPKSFGFLSTLLAVAEHGESYNIRSMDGKRESRGFTRIDKALRALIGWGS